MIEICAVGGYGEVGKNMTAVKIEDEVIILDVGLHLPNYVKVTEEERDDIVKYSATELKKARAIPEDDIINEWRPLVKAIIPSHAHLDHIGAIPYLAARYDAPIICTKYTAEVIKKILADNNQKIPNKIQSVNPNTTVKITPNIKAEFINMTHSTPQTATIALHTKEGVILYTNDFKLDNTPVLGKIPNYERLQKLSQSKIAILDTLYCDTNAKTPSESVAKELLRDVLKGIDNKGKAIIVSTFSSHIARLKSITEFGNQLGRKVVFLGRSLAKYAYSAEDTGIYYFTKQGVEIVKYSNHVRKKLKHIAENRDKYLLVVTGHQGEPKSILSKIVQNQFAFRLQPDDHVIFSSNIIPNPINIQHREAIEAQLKELGVRIFRGIHVSGHGAREDLRELLKIIQPKNIIPSHSEQTSIKAFLELGRELGYTEGKNMFPLLTSQRITLK